jgi:hypothetical protein
MIGWPDSDPRGDRIRRLFETVAADPSLRRPPRRGSEPLGFFIQDPAIGWGLGWEGERAMVLDRFPYHSGNRLFFRRLDDFLRYAGGTPWFWLALRGRVHCWGGHGALRRLRGPLRRAFRRFDRRES